jgi:hypothetical protein
MSKFVSENHISGQVVARRNETFAKHIEPMMKRGFTTSEMAEALNAEKVPRLVPVPGAIWKSRDVARVIRMSGIGGSVP